MKKGLILNCKDPNVPHYVLDLWYNGTGSLPSTPSFGDEFLQVCITTSGDDQLTCNTLMLPPSSSGFPSSIEHWEAPSGAGVNDESGFNRARTRVHNRDGDSTTYAIYNRPWIEMDEQEPAAAYCANRWKRHYYSTVTKTTVQSVDGNDREYSFMMLDHEGADESINYRVTWLDEAIQNTSNARYLVAGCDNTIARIDTTLSNAIGFEWGHSGASQYTMYGLWSRPTYVHSEDKEDNYGWYNVSDQVSTSVVNTGIGNEHTRTFAWEYGYEYLFYIRSGPSSNIINAVQITMHPRADSISAWKLGNKSNWLYGANGAQYSSASGTFPKTYDRVRLELIYSATPSRRRIAFNANNHGDQRAEPANTTHWAYKRPIPLGSDTIGGGGGSVGGGGGCVALDTPVWMEDGSTKQAQYIKAGDVILGYNLPGMKDGSESDWESWTTNNIDGEVVPVVVKTAILDWYKEYYVINNDLKITQQHMIFVCKNGIWGWVDVRDMEVGDQLVDLDENIVDITSIRKVSERLDVVTLDVEDVDTYFVGNHPILVHNADTVVKH